MKPRVFVVQPIPESALDILRSVADVEVHPSTDRMITLAEMLDGARRSDYLVALHSNFIPADVVQAPGLKGIGVLGGKDARVDFDAALACKVAIVSRDPAERMAGGGVSQATADLTVGMVVALAYRLTEADRHTRVGHFQQQSMALMGVGCSGKTVGLLGLGRVARHMVPRLRAFDMQVIYTKRTRLAADEEQTLGVSWADDRDAVLRQADFVCVEVDYSAATHAWIGARELALMKPTAYLVNTARGRVVDESALVAALQAGTIAGAALDVYWNEPPVVYQAAVPAALCALENVILAPHNGGATHGVRSQMFTSVANGLVALINGERPPGSSIRRSSASRVRYPENYGRGPMLPLSMGGSIQY